MVALAQLNRFQKDVKSIRLRPNDEMYSSDATFQKDVKSIRLRPSFREQVTRFMFQKDVKSIRLRPLCNVIYASA